MKKVLFVVSIGLFLVLISSVRADCVVPTDGMVIDEFTWFCSGTYYLPNGITITNPYNVYYHPFLDCNGATLIGNNIPLKGGISVIIPYVNIINCTIKNYDQCIRMGNTGNLRLVDNTFYNCSLAFFNSDNNIIFNNNFVNSSLELATSNNNLVIKNIFYESSIFVGPMGIGDTSFPSSFNNRIYNNTFIGKSNPYGSNIIISILHPYSFYNEFCVNDIGNTYLDGATGPTCEDLPINKRVSLLELTVNNIWNKILDIINDFKLLDERVDALEGVTTTTTTTISSTTTIGSTSTTTTTTTIISVCKGKTYSTCISLSNCKWVGDLRTGHCESK